MKPIHLVSVLALLLGTTLADARNAPSRKETLAWLQERLPDLSQGTWTCPGKAGGDGPYKFEYKVTSASFEDATCKVKLEHMLNFEMRHSDGTTGRNEDVTDVEFALGDLQKAALLTVRFTESCDAPPAIYLNTPGKRKEIFEKTRRRHYIDGKLHSNEENSGQKDEIAFRVSDRESGQRLVKAFNDAIKLCSAGKKKKKEPY